ncbi:MAG: hypothetical protein ACFCVK_14135 [Acidimicrobiales bacterium]
MFVKVLRTIGLTSGLAHVAGLLSVGVSIATWAAAKSATDRASGQRLGIFIGLWAPTFILIGNALQIDETAEKAALDTDRPIRSAA